MQEHLNKILSEINLKNFNFIITKEFTEPVKQNYKMKINSKLTESNIDVFYVTPSDFSENIVVEIINHASKLETFEFSVKDNFLHLLLNHEEQYTK